jgi:hypothetical protein
VRSAADELGGAWLGEGRLVGQHAAQMVVHLGGVGVLVPGDRALFSSAGSPVMASVQPTSLGTARQSRIFLVMEVSPPAG